MQMQTNPARTQTQIQQGPEKTYLCTGFFFFFHNFLCERDY